MKLYGALRQCSNGHDTSLVLCCLDTVVAGLSQGKLEAGEDHQLPLKAVHTHGCIGQDHSQGPEADYCPSEPGLRWGQRGGAQGTGNWRHGFFFHTIQFFRGKAGHSESPLLPGALDDGGSHMQPLDVFPS